MAALLALYAGYYWGNRQVVREIPASLLRLPAPLALAPFELLDQDGETFTNSYLNRRWSLLLSGRPPISVNRSAFMGSVSSRSKAP